MGAVLPILTARFPAFGKAVYEAGKEYRALHAGARRIAFYHGEYGKLGGVCAQQQSERIRRYLCQCAYRPANVYAVCQRAVDGVCAGFVPVASYNYGHGDKQRVKECFRIALITMFSFNLVLMLFMICFPAIVASAFTSDARLIETVRWTMPVFLGGMTIFGLQRACQNMFVALGQARISIFIALLRKVILLIPLALILPHFMGVAGVYAAEAISDATAAICCTLLFFWQFPKILRRIKSKSLSE